jgi:hypothetical protein
MCSFCVSSIGYFKLKKTSYFPLSPLYRPQIHLNYKLLIKLVFHLRAPA